MWWWPFQSTAAPSLSQQHEGSAPHDDRGASTSSTTTTLANGGSVTTRVYPNAGATASERSKDGTAAPSASSSTTDEVNTDRSAATSSSSSSSRRALDALLEQFSTGAVVPASARTHPRNHSRGRRGGGAPSSRGEHEHETDEQAAAIAAATAARTSSAAAASSTSTKMDELAGPAKLSSLASVWHYGAFLANQSTALANAFVRHHVIGPPKQSWGVELTLFTTLMREVSAYSHLAELERLRSVLELGSLLPMPRDGIVTPVSFRVRRRGLRGFLAEADAKEDGSRRVTGEWVINKRLWHRMQHDFVKRSSSKERPTQERRASSSTAASSATRTSSAAQGASSAAGAAEKVILYLHGGAYYTMSASTHRFLTISISRYTECRVFAINYRLAPETRFPGQLHDAVSAYMRLTVDMGIPPEHIVIAGDSAGGGLALATLMYLRDNQYPLPSGAILQSPWVDLTMSCESWTTNKPYDYLPAPNDDHLHPVRCLLGDDIDKYLTHPYVSPLFGDFRGLPPMLVQAGDAEVLRDEITLLAHKASRAGVRVEHELFQDAVHVFQVFLFLEASRKAFQSQRRFVRHTLPRLAQRAAAVAAANAAAAASATASPAEAQEAPARPQPPATRDADYAQIDREITADAHKVDAAGQAESASLLPSPAVTDTPLPDATDEDEADGEEAEEDDESSAPESLSDRAPSPVAEPEPLRQGSSRRGSASTIEPPGRRPTTVRPILRAYVSQRDLGMTTSSPKRSGSRTAPTSPRAAGGSSTISLPSLTSLSGARHRRSSTVATAKGTNLSADSASRSPNAAVIPLERREYEPGPMRARSNSHPDLRAMIDSYNEETGHHSEADEGEDESSQDARCLSTVYAPAREGHATPPSSSSPPRESTSNLTGVAPETTSMTPETDAAESELPQRRPPSFIGESPGFGFF